MSTRSTAEPLRAYQAEAVRHLVREPYAGLLLDPGLGKTRCVLEAFRLLRRHNHVDRLLVLAPLRACHLVWPREVDKWEFEFETAVLHGGKKEAALETAHRRSSPIWALNYEGLPWFADAAARRRVDLSKTWLVLDESTKVKHTRTQRFRLLRPLLPAFRRRTILTGTPSPNGLIDLFGQLYCVDLGRRLGAYVTHYRRRWFYPSGYGGYTWVPQESAEREIRAAISDVCLRFDDRVLGLPKYHVNTIQVELPPKARALYTTLERDFVALLRDRAVVATNAGVLSTKLRQVANGGVYGDGDRAMHLHDEKTEAVADLVEELSGSPLLVAYEFGHDRDRLLKGLGRPPHVGGDVPAKEQIRRLDDFNRGRYPVLLCQSGAVAHALNLQEACHTVCWHSLTWNLEHYIQLIKRVHRQGQQRRVTVHHVVARDTIDERIIETLGRKDQSQRTLLEGLRRHYLRDNS